MSTAFSSLGSSTLTTWKRRASAASRSKYFLYSAQVVAATVRSSPRAKAGLRRLAASPCPACPPAPIMVCTLSMNRMIGLGDSLTSSMTDLRRFSNSPFTPAPAWSKPRSRTPQGDILQTSGYVSLHDTLGKTFDDGGLSDAGLAGENRVVLASSGEDVDHLANLRITTQHGVDLAGGRPRLRSMVNWSSGRRLRAGSHGSRCASTVGRSRFGGGSGLARIAGDFDQSCAALDGNLLEFA